MKPAIRMVLVSSIVVALSALAHAHFVLLEPASWLVENRLGDPQKLGPCGGTSADSGTPTNAIGKVRGGDKVHLKVQETIFHPGHYRVALAINSRAELPPDPEVTTRDTERGPWSVSAVIQNPPQVPVLADGLFVHTARPTNRSKRTSSYRTSPAKSARCRLSSSWRNTASTRMAATPIITAPICRSRRIRASRSTRAGKGGADSRQAHALQPRG